jgi:hypothetical protein
LIPLIAAHFRQSRRRQSCVASQRTAAIRNANRLEKFLAYYDTAICRAVKVSTAAGNRLIHPNLLHTMKITNLITSIATIITCLAISQPTATAAGEEGGKEGAKRKVVIGFIAKSLANDVFPSRSGRR